MKEATVTDTLHTCHGKNILVETSGDCHVLTDCQEEFRESAGNGPKPGRHQIAVNY